MHNVKVKSTTATEPLARGYKTHNEFHDTSYEMYIHLRFFSSHKLTQYEKKQDKKDIFRESGTDDTIAWLLYFHVLRTSWHDAA